ncbi:hypothetical protein GOBAR_AA10481 [Gossypium barbadense]|uniref:Uncharacterized protein n=1 Tax=Gossypium barbadense TaxID=3634 RepID=A0A2P5Y3H3_GOSBA|nr:hypothetical protein GOBAR_AA10481 [Gossypium barbadense]
MLTICLTFHSPKITQQSHNNKEVSEGSENLIGGNIGVVEGMDVGINGLEPIEGLRGVGLESEPVGEDTVGEGVSVTTDGVDDAGIGLDAVGEGASVEICGSSSEAGSKEEAFLVDVHVGSDMDEKVEAIRKKVVRQEKQIFEDNTEGDSGDSNEDDANEGVHGERKVGVDMVDDDMIKENEGKLEGHESDYIDSEDPGEYGDSDNQSDDELCGAY